MEFTNVQSALVLLPDSADAENTVKQSPLYQALLAASSANNIRTAPVNNLPVNETFDAIVAVGQSFTSQQLEQLFKILNPNFYLYIAKSESTAKNLSFLLKVSGFVVAQDTDSVLIARKPDYEVGSSVKIDLDGADKKKIWSIAADDDFGDDDLINDDELLDEQDKLKPSAEELRVCATTKQRKACANCSCGLAEELEKEEINKIRESSQNAKSSCGNCYLGDAFRCAACPYRGMPAFKPGEKVVLDTADGDL